MADTINQTPKVNVTLLEHPCKVCEDKAIEIAALKTVMGKLERGENAFNWVGHEIGLRKKIKELETKYKKIISQRDKIIETKRINHREDVERKEMSIKRWKDNFHRVRKEHAALTCHWLLGWFNKRLAMKQREREDIGPMV